MKKYQHRSAWSKSRKINIKLGFLLSLSFVFFAFQWSVPLHVPTSTLIIETTVADIINIPRTSYPNQFKSPPPVAPTQLTTPKKPTEFVIDENPVEDQNDFIDDSSDSEFFDDFVEEKEEIKGSQIMVQEKEEEPIVIWAQRMPAWKECADLETEEERKTCTDRSLIQYIASHTYYPAMARELNIQGTIPATFVIDKNGKITEIEILRDLGHGTKEAVEKVIKKLPSFAPGKQNGAPVKVRLTIPVRFSLD